MKYLICLFFWLSGVFLALALHYSFFPNDVNKQTFNNKISYTQIEKIANVKAALYFERATDLFFHNLYVAFLLSIGGLFTAGSLSLITITYNGFMATSIISHFYLQNSLIITFSKLIHAPFEIIALIWFGSIGLCGATLTSKFIKNKQITINDFYILKETWKPFLLLLIAALIEAK